ncbi:MAG: T9SS type A sorting domain-containing protein [Flavobacteriaceae bacterium]|nr:T9SS type A sorting domain-containing protein [Flavobacteriaceae bacterium]
MKTQLIIKNNFWLWAILLLITNTTFSQGFCVDFDDKSNTALVSTPCDGNYYPNVLDNWGGANFLNNGGMRYQDTNSQGGAGDYFLFLDDGSCGNGSTVAYNPVDFSGNWLQMVPQQDGCFCYDLRVFHVQVGTITSYSSLRIFDGPDPSSSTLSAVFSLTTPIDVAQGWVRICAPVALSTGSSLPGNADGQWVINTGNAVDWDTLIQNVGSMAFFVDVASGDEKWGIDNICISDICDATVGGDPQPTPDGAFCCDENENLAINGNFEYGNTGFSSNYTQNVATLPGQYDVTNTAVAFGATVTDHSYCVDSALYPNNDLFLLVNGRTSQPVGTQSTIWGQSMVLDPEKEYRFCANFKNMPQCTFDILPEITIITSSGYSQTATINTDPSDPCDWQLESFCFRGDQQTSIRILLNEDGLGDGNDLAIDDISIQALSDANLSITVQHQGNPQVVTGSINTISTTDDLLPYDPVICPEPWYWYVITLSSATNGSFVIDFSAPYGWGNTTGYSLFNPSTSGSTPWDLTTNFIPYPFQQNTLYLIGMTTPSCCEDCVNDGFTYQIIYNNNAPVPMEEGLTEEQKRWIKSWLGTYGSLGLGELPLIEDHITIYPNPSKSLLNIANTSSVAIDKVEIVTVSGTVINAVETNVKTIDIQSLSSGIYFLKLYQEGNTITKKFIKE